MIRNCDKFIIICIWNGYYVLNKWTKQTKNEKITEKEEEITDILQRSELIWSSSSRGK